ncbi:SH3 domain-containing protein [Oscillatoria sp. CS-180]|uniref:SH3 domain-containing protein n=1 Tax=Oscillatoria sp. CS-180 TaxID=3021720 RepID=UPI00232F29D3|nr:SH3 domain-containing protein [Oscillatoria sp. CS-180]MDB9525093.1 SH3 domain-containing protein [Oscillatoria sp. CS-180]
MKKLLFGSAIVFASLIGLVSEVRAEVPVRAVCSQATWTDGYNIWEVIPLSPSQYRTAFVIDGPVNVRAGLGYDAEVLFTLDSGNRVTVTGEGWDMDCNQWMRIRIGSNLYWVHGNYITP